MINTNWRDVYDERTDTHMRVSPEVLAFLGRENVLQVALHLKKRNPKVASLHAKEATGYWYTANGMKLSIGVAMINSEQGRVRVFMIATREQWDKWHAPVEPRECSSEESCDQ